LAARSSTTVPEDYNLTREEVADTNMSVPCFLVIHAKGILLFDTGLSDRLVGRPLYETWMGATGRSSSIASAASLPISV